MADRTRLVGIYFSKPSRSYEVLGRLVIANVTPSKLAHEARLRGADAAIVERTHTQDNGYVATGGGSTTYQYGNTYQTYANPVFFHHRQSTIITATLITFQ
jgi:hypothetical protein